MFRSVLRRDAFLLVARSTRAGHGMQQSGAITMDGNGKQLLDDPKVRVDYLGE